MSWSKGEEMYYNDLVNLELIFEHPKYRSMSIYRVMLDSSLPLFNLKEDLQYRLKTEPNDQVWYHKGNLIPEGSTLKERGVKPNDKLLVRVSGTNRIE